MLNVFFSFITFSLSAPQFGGTLKEKLLPWFLNNSVSNNNKDLSFYFEGKKPGKHDRARLSGQVRAGKTKREIQIHYSAARIQIVLLFHWNVPRKLKNWHQETSKEETGRVCMQ